MLALNSSTQAKLFHSLFPKDTSYFKYKPLDIATRILNGRKNRVARTAFLQLLAGSSPLITSAGFHVRCKFCNKPKINSEHLFFECPKLKKCQQNLIAAIEKQFIHHGKIKLLLHFRELLSSKNFSAALAILFGSNHLTPSNQLTRKFRQQKNHPSDFIIISTLDFIDRNLNPNQ